MVTTRLDPLPTELFDIDYRSITDRVERRSRGPVSRGLGAVRQDILTNSPVSGVVSSLYNGELTPAVLYRDMSQLLVDLDIPIDPIQDYLERSGRSVMRISGREIARRVENYMLDREGLDYQRRDVIFDERPATDGRGHSW